MISKEPDHYIPQFKNAKEIRKIATAYMKCCRGEELLDGNGAIIRDKTGIPIRYNARPPTLIGLALALGFDSRQGFLAFTGNHELVYELNRAKAYVEEYTEERLFDKDGIGGAKFILANDFTGWSERPRDSTEQAALDKLDELMEVIDSATKL